MLYAPTDTVTSNSADEDTPWAEAELLPEMRAEAVVADGLISGLGAHNTKGHAACAMVAFEASAESDVVPSGELLSGLGAGGMRSGGGRVGKEGVSTRRTRGLR